MNKFIKKSIIYLLLLVPAMAFSQQIKFNVKGNIGKYNAPSKAFLLYFQDGAAITDSCVFDKGQFKFTGTVQGPVKNAMLIIDSIGNGKIMTTREYGYHFTRLFLEKGIISISSANQLDNALVTGTPVNDEYSKFRQKPENKISMAKVNINWDKWLMAILSRPRDTAAARQSSIKLRLELKDLNAREEKYLNEHPDSYVSLYFLQMLSGRVKAEVLEPQFAKFSTRIKKSPLGKEIATEIEQAKSLHIGNPAPDFSSTDTSGVALSLSSLRGKYVLIDFWASWCAPCRQETPNLKRVFDKFKDNNFTILSVSLDKNKKDWTNAILKDGMPWYHVSSLQYWADPVAKKYNIAAIPQNVLVDPSGKVIGINLIGIDLEKKMEELIKSR